MVGRGMSVLGISVIIEDLRSTGISQLCCLYLNIKGAFGGQQRSKCKVLLLSTVPGVFYPGGPYSS